MAKKAVRKAAPAAVAPPATGSARLRPAPEPVRAARKPVPGALAGLRVLDVTSGLAGGFASTILAWFGADVWKLEPPAAGDPGRAAEPRLGDVGAVFAELHRGKRSVALDLRRPAGREAAAKVAACCDILLDESAAGAIAELSEARLRKRNPRLIHVALSARGGDGLAAGRELNILAETGLLDLVGGRSLQPTLPGVRLVEVAGGALPAVIGALLALAARERTGRGQAVDVSLLDGAVGLLGGVLADYAATRRLPRPGQDPLLGKYACYNLYPARSGRWLAVAALDPACWSALCEGLGRPDLVADHYAEGDRQRVVVAELTRIFQRRGARDWIDLFEGKNAGVSEVRALGDALRSPELAERGAVVELRTERGGAYPHIGVYPRLSETPGDLLGEPPRLGAHTREALALAGYSEAAIRKLAADGVAKTG